MRIVCAECSIVMADGPAEPVSHGLCGRCFTKYLEIRPTTDHEWNLMRAREPDAKTADLLIWFDKSMTHVAGHDYSFAYSFDCRLSADSAQHHYESEVLK